MVNRKLEVEGIWCGDELTLKITQPRSYCGDLRYSVVATDDDDWIAQSPMLNLWSEAECLIEDVVTNAKTIGDVFRMIENHDPTT
jgi:hypothetical protein